MSSVISNRKHSEARETYTLADVFNRHESPDKVEVRVEIDQRWCRAVQSYLYNDFQLSQREMEI